MIDAWSMANLLTYSMIAYTHSRHDDDAHEDVIAVLLSQTPAADLASSTIVRTNGPHRSKRRTGACPVLDAAGEIAQAHGSKYHWQMAPTNSLVRARRR